MKQIEPELGRLEASARFAGEHGASWWDFLLASHESLSKAAGRGAAIEDLQSPQAYETARAGLFAAWSQGSMGTDVSDTVPAIWPWEASAWGDGEKMQAEPFDTAEARR